MHYCLQWENPSNFPDFAEYIKRVPNDPFSANCSICRGKPFQLSHIGKRVLKSHAEGEKHQDALRLRRTVGPLFTPAVPEGEPSTEILISLPKRRQRLEILSCRRYPKHHRPVLLFCFLTLLLKFMGLLSFQSLLYALMRHSIQLLIKGDWTCIVFTVLCCCV